MQQAGVVPITNVASAPLGSEGRKVKRSEGRKEGRKEGREEGRKEGRKEDEGR
jgi:hypothetical protein